MENTQTVRAAAEPKVTVHILRGKAARASRELKGPSLLIGSHSQCDIQMRSADVAPRHCLLSRQRGGVSIVQLDANAPVLLNGVAVHEQELADGDKLMIGPFELGISIVPPAGGKVRPAPQAPEERQPRRVMTQTYAAAPPATEHGTSSDVVATGYPEGEQAAILSAKASEDAGRMLEDIRRELHSQRREVAEKRSQLQAEESQQTRRKDWLTEQQRTLSSREESLRAAERELERQRVSITDELLDLDRRDQTIDQQKSRLLHVRRQLFEKYRERRQSLTQLVEDLKGQSTQLDAERKRLADDRASLHETEAKLTEWQSELTQRERDLERQSTRIVEAGIELRREQEKLQAQRESLLGVQQSLDKLRRDLDDRQTRLNELEVAAQDVKRQASADLDRAQAELAKVQQWSSEIERKERALQEQERQLEDLAQRFEHRRRAQDEHDRKLTALAQRLQTLDATQKTAGERLEQREQSIRIRERSLEEQATYHNRREAELQALATEYESERSLLDRRAKELEGHAAAILDKLEAERQSLERRESQLSVERQSVEADRQAFEGDKAKWLERVGEMREFMSELSVRTTALDEQEERLRLEQQQYRSERDMIESEKQSIEDQRRKIQAEKSAVHELSGKIGQTAAELESESARLQNLSRELEERQEQILGRERAWCEDVKQRRAELKTMSDELEQKRAKLNQEAREHRQRILELESARASKPVAQVEQSTSPSAVPDWEQVTAKQRRLVDAVLEYVERQAKTNQKLTNWVGQLRREHTRLVEGRRTVEEGVQHVLDAWRKQESAEAGDASEPRILRFQRAASEPRLAADHLEQSLETWANEFDQLEARLGQQQTEIEQREKEIAAGRQELSRLLALLEEYSETLTSGTEPDSAGEPPNTVSTLPFATPTAAQPMKLGPATVLNTLHEGTIATTYRVAIPDYSTPMCVRLLRSPWCKGAERRESFHSAIRALRGFHHPNVVTLHDTFAAGDRLGCVMDYVDGCSLRQLAAVGIPPRAVVSFCCQAVRALEAAQRLGFVHRNLWPSRLLVDREGTVRITGYGEPDWLLKAHRCEKSPEFAKYVGPEERMVGVRIDVRSDIFAVGHVFRDIVLGARHESRSESRQYPPKFLGLLEQMVQGKPTDRCRSVGTVVRMLDDLLAEMDQTGELWPDLPAVIDSLQRQPAASRKAA